MNRVLRNIFLFAVLFAAWLLMSGHYTPLLISLGVLSCALATVMADRIGGSDEEGLPLHIMARLPAYLVWLLKEIIMSNIATGVVTYANSITLTPGTVTIEVAEKNGTTEFLVHAVDQPFADDVESGEMDRRVTALEAGHRQGDGA